MSAYKILKYANSILQGQFKKYPCLIQDVALKCVESSKDLKDSKEMFNQINLAVARILDSSGDEQEIMRLAQKLNKLANYEKGTIKLYPATQSILARYGVTIEGRGDLDDVTWNSAPTPHVGKEVWVIITGGKIIAGKFAEQ